MEDIQRRYGKYGNPPRDDRFHNRKQPFRSFEESRRRNECHKCGDRWHPRHRCRAGSIRNHIRERLKNGVSSVHIVSDLVSGLEGELAGELEEKGEIGATEEQEGENDEARVNFGDSSNELALFDSFAQKDPACDIRWMNDIDTEWFTNHLHTSMAEGERIPGLPHETDFYVGDKI